MAEYFHGWKKKIALCLEYPLALRGGVSVLVETLLTGLALQYDLVLVSPDQPQVLTTHPAGQIISTHIPWSPAAVSPKTSRELAQTLATQSVKLAHFHFGGSFGWGNRFPGHCPIPYANKLGIATCSTVHSVVNLLDGYCGPQKPLWFKLALLPLALAGKLHQLSQVRHEIGVSEHDTEKLRRRYWPARKKFLRIYHSRLRENSPRAPVPREPVILNVGHIAARKGQLVLTEAFAQIAPRHPEWQLHFAGEFLEPRIAEAIRGVAQAHGLRQRIQLLGERPDAMELMMRAGIYVQPSLQEALGLALQEALFLGGACVGTRVGGIPELIAHERTGLLVEPNDPTQLAQAMERLLSSAPLRQEYGERGAASIVQKGMTAEQMTARHLELYAAILAGE